MIENKELTIYYDMQCPYIYQNIETIKQYCEANDVPVTFSGGYAAKGKGIALCF